MLWSCIEHLHSPIQHDANHVSTVPGTPLQRLLRRTTG